MIGIIGAMSQEVAKLKAVMSGVEVENRAGMEFFKGTINGKEIVVVRSGIGKVNAAVCSQILADCYHVTAIINTGIAGSLRNEINIGDIVLSEDTLQHDMDATGFGYPLGHIPQMDQSVFEGDKRMIEAAKACCARVVPEIGVHVGRVLSGDQFVSDIVKKAWLTETFDGYCTEMEGAAIAQTAFLNKIPFLIIRAISDKADDSAEMDYEVFEEKAIKHSVKLVLALLETLD
ncbi:MAG: 5'-methylthioadenosine/adenosylhomocysteine nucleosidase [Hungatella sp.]|nr:5'-methylthioadenosine/adenosylhomocysteine nucleosidase [Hungatella sp.]